MYDRRADIPNEAMIERAQDFLRNNAIYHPTVDIRLLNGTTFVASGIDIEKSGFVAFSVNEEQGERTVFDFVPSQVQSILYAERIVSPAMPVATRRDGLIEYLELARVAPYSETVFGSGVLVEALVADNHFSSTPATRFYCERATRFSEHARHFANLTPNVVMDDLIKIAELFFEDSTLVENLVRNLTLPELSQAYRHIAHGKIHLTISEDKVFNHPEIMIETGIYLFKKLSPEDRKMVRPKSAYFNYLRPMTMD